MKFHIIVQPIKRFLLMLIEFSRFSVIFVSQTIIGYFEPLRIVYY